MKFITEVGTVYKPRKDYWLTMYPIRENKTTPCSIQHIIKNLKPLII